MQWGQVQGHEGTVALFLNFIRPIQLFMVLEFNIVRQGILVEAPILHCDLDQSEGTTKLRTESEQRWLLTAGAGAGNSTFRFSSLK